LFPTIQLFIVRDFIGPFKPYRAKALSIRLTTHLQHTNR